MGIQDTYVAHAVHLHVDGCSYQGKFTIRVVAESGTCSRRRSATIFAGLLSAVDTEEEAQSKPFVASMGMYVFKKSVLKDLLFNKFPEVRCYMCACPHNHLLFERLTAKSS